LRLGILLIFLWLSVTIGLSACTPCEPVISPGFTQEIREALGYVLAPTYLPEGFKTTKAVEGVSPVLTTGGTVSVHLMYTEYSPGQGPTLVLRYPETYWKSSPMMEELGLIVPEDAVSDIRINGEAAFLFHGSWTEETLDRVARLIMPINPEWDYENASYIRFAFAIPDGERIWVRLGTVWPNDEVTEKDLIRIAESVVLVD